MDMQGLHNFIADIRKASNNREEEEKRVSEELAKIKSKFKNSASLSAYDRRKYVCKLMFISMLGYEVSFGRMEALELLSQKTQADKLIGYLAVTVFLHENHELTTLVTHTVNLDLISGKEFNMTLALAAISNIGGRDFAEAMSANVTKILASKSYSHAIKKRALLTTLRLYRKYPEVLSVDRLLPVAIGSITGGLSDLGVMNCALSLLTGLLNTSESSPELTALFDTVPTHCSNIMNMIIGLKQTPIEYMYYGVPAPWIQMKCLRLLQFFPIPDDTPMRRTMLTNLGKIVRSTTAKYREAQQQEKKRALQNQCAAMIAVFVEVVGLAVHWDCDTQLLNDCTELMSLLIRNEKNPNMRYTGLKLMTRLAFCQSPNFSFDQRVQQHQQQIIIALRDTDISIRRSALDLLYNMCSKNTCEEIVGELLLLLPVSDTGFRGDLVLMIAVIAEKFCTDFAWYVEVMLQVITQAGDEVPADIWQRLCHIVVNNEAVQKQAAETILKALTTHEHVSEILVKVAAFLLGEFGYQIAINTDSGPLTQFTALQSRFLLVGSETKAMILTTFVKFYNLYDNPSLRDKVRKAIQGCKSNMDPEIQQRATEYFVLITSVSDTILQETLEPMLPFEIKTHTLLDRLVERQKGADRNLWSEKAQQRDMEQIQIANEERQKNQEQATAAGGNFGVPLASEQTVGNLGATTSNRSEDSVATSAKPKPSFRDPFAEPSDSNPAPLASIQSSPSMGLGATTTSILGVTTASSLAGKTAPKTVLDDIFQVSPPLPANIPTAASSSAFATMKERNFPLLCVSEAGPLYEDDTVLVQVNPHQYRNADGRLSLAVQNKRQGPLTAVSSRISAAITSLMLQSKPHEAVIEPGCVMNILFAARCLSVYEGAPEIQLAYVKPAPNAENVTLSLPLPIVCTRFISPYHLDEPAKFLGLWANTPTGDIRLSELNSLTCNKVLDIVTIESILFQRLRFHCIRVSAVQVYGIGAHAVQPAAAPEFQPVMAMVELGPTDNAVRFAVRTSNPTLQKLVYDTFVQQLLSAD